MTLHEAIKLILQERKSPLKPQEVADIVNNRNLYSKKDGGEVSINQIHARISNYSDLFILKEGKIHLVGDTYDSIQAISKKIRNFTSHAPALNFDLLFPFILIVARFSSNKHGRPQLKNINFSELLVGTFHEKRARLTNIMKRLSDDDAFGESAHLITNVLEQSREEEIRNLLSLVDDLNLDELSEEQFEEVFSNYLQSFSRKDYDNQYKTPEIVIRYIKRFVKLAGGDTICDPFAGDGRLITEIVSKKSSQITVHLHEINPKAVLLGKMRIFIGGLENINYLKGDVFRRSNSESTQFKYHWVVSNPPFGMLLSNQSINNIFDGSGEEKDVIRLTLSLLADKGKAILLLPEAFFFNKSFERVRNELILQDVIEEVHSFPVGALAPATQNKSSVLFLNKAKAESFRNKVLFKEIDISDLNVIDPEQVQLFDKRTMNKERVVGLEEIRNNDWILSANRYLNFFKFDDSYVELRKVVKKIRYGNDISKQDLRKKGKTHFIQISNLSDSEQDVNLSLDKVEYYVSEKIDYSNNLINKEVVLIAKVGNKIKPTFYDGSTPILIASNIIGFEVDENQILPKYLIHELQKNYIQEQFDRIRGGTVYSFVRQKDLLDIRIKVPPINLQKLELEKLYVQFRTDLIKKEVTIKADTERKLLSSIKHEFSNLKTIVDGDIFLLKSFLERKIELHDKLSWNDEISLMPDSRKLNQLFSNIQNTLAQMGAVFPTLQQIMDFSKEKMRKEPVSIVSFIKDQVELLKSSLSGVSVYYLINDFPALNKNDIVINLDKGQFATVIQNFLFNSVKHAFEQEDELSKTIFFTVSLAEDHLSAEIIMMNNGQPLKDNFTIEDFVSFGGKTSSSGTGIGGYLMNRVIENHNGTLELLDISKIQNYFIDRNQNELYDKNIDFSNRDYAKEYKEYIIEDFFENEKPPLASPLDFPQMVAFIPGIAFKITIPID